MTAKILLAYATATETTSTIARAISNVLKLEGCDVDTALMSDNPTISEYDAVILGSAVQYDNWLPEAVDYVREHQHDLDGLPIVLFTVHIQNLGQDYRSVTNRLHYTDEIRELIHIRDEAFFAGRFTKEGAKQLVPRWIAWAIPKTDLRNWTQIEHWASTLPMKLSLHVTPEFS